eukprot:CAMPEP_0204365390 /NCGR_PEP_ID=MMETSP0469-20131031/41877_1 /ASSEMBLY_ACC=CAM_ASM_000384 /TAXON_ID=2969 /ORGANISM="Oxyrrhis marina" /LENGTH=100 /DNA_ID=CAMNT_0051354447 /DNA_START=83 /DNA_END=382 /DNA_ORIENTATION=+
MYGTGSPGSKKEAQERTYLPPPRKTARTVAAGLANTTLNHGAPAPPTMLVVLQGGTEDLRIPLAWLRTRLAASGTPQRCVPKVEANATSDFLGYLPTARY